MKITFIISLKKNFPFFSLINCVWLRLYWSFGKNSDVKVSWTKLTWDTSNRLNASSKMAKIWAQFSGYLYTYL